MHIETDTHTHTIISGHAYSSLQENVAAAKMAGLKLLATTDHASSMPGSPHFWYFENLTVVPRIIDGVGVLRGCEANIINASGEIDISDSLAKKLDVVIGSLHEPVFAPSSEQEHTDALMGAITSGKINILGHLGNPRFPFDIDRVVKAAAENQVMIEINNSSFGHSRAGSRPNCLRIAQAAKKHGAFLTFSSDAHISFAIGNYDQCIALVKEIDFPEKRIVSTKAQKLLDFLIASGKDQLCELREMPELQR